MIIKLISSTLFFTLITFINYASDLTEIRKDRIILDKKHRLAIKKLEDKIAYEKEKNKLLKILLNDPENSHLNENLKLNKIKLIENINNLKFKMIKI